MKKCIAVAVVAAGLFAAPGPAAADLFELKWSSEGYFRTRTMLLTNLAAQDRREITYPVNGERIVIPEIRNTSYITSRLRLMPTVSFAKLAKMSFQIDAMDDVLWGDNNGVASAPLLATETSSQPYLGGEVEDSVVISKAWIEFQIPVGMMRVGRMPSHWGMGLLANGGGTGMWDPNAPEYEQRKHPDYFFDDDFGENHFGSVADRILFITKPLTIARTISKEKDTSSNFILGYAYDKISEAPLFAAEPFERQFRPFGQQGFISRGKSDDVTEHVFIAVYADTDWDVKRFTDQLIFGTYVVLRDAKETSTNPSDEDLTGPIDPDNPPNCNANDEGLVPCKDDGAFVWIADIWWRVRYGELYTEGEFYHIGGETFGGIPFPAANQRKTADINGGVARFGYLTDLWDGLLEVGHASGDDRLEDESFKQRALHPDFNVGLILFEEILREQTARLFGTQFFSDENPEGAKGLMSNGGVINANYIAPKGRWRPGVAGLELVGQFMAAWVDTKATTGTALFYDTAIKNGREVDLPSFLGWEIDLALKSSFAGDHMLFSLETGYLRYGGALKELFLDGATGDPNADSSFTLQSRVAFVW